MEAVASLGPSIEPQSPPGGSWSALGGLAEILDLDPERLRGFRVGAGTVKLVAIALLRYARRDARGGGARPALATLARAACVSVRSVRWALRALEGLGIIACEKSPGNKPRSYRVRPGARAGAARAKVAAAEPDHAARAAFGRAFLDRYGVEFLGHRGVDWGELARVCERVAPHVAPARAMDLVFARYMRETGAVAEAHHPPRWLGRLAAGYAVEFARRRPSNPIGVAAVAARRHEPAPLPRREAVANARAAMAAVAAVAS